MGILNVVGLFLIFHLSCGPAETEKKPLISNANSNISFSELSLSGATSANENFCHFLCPKKSLKYDLVSCSNNGLSQLTCVYQGEPDRYWCSCPTDDEVGRDFWFNNKQCRNNELANSFVCNYNRDEDEPENNEPPEDDGDSNEPPEDGGDSNEPPENGDDEDVITTQYPATCKELKHSQGITSDGQHQLFINNDPNKMWEAYCHGMGGGSPLEFLSLGQGEDKNYALYAAGGASRGLSVKTIYSKVRVDPRSLVILGHDQTFASSSGSLRHAGSTLVTSMPYGIAMGCDFRRLNGKANVDLSGSPFKLKNDYTAAGHAARMVLTIDEPQRKEMTAGGYCGWASATEVFNPINDAVHLLDLEYIGYPKPEIEQYTPEQANWDSFSSKPFVNGVNEGHDPDGVSWISQEQWEASKWDGTAYNPSTMNHNDFVQAICPSVDRVRGIREVFYQHKPFADNMNPTKAEVDEWHRIAINHIRALVGYTQEDRQVKKDHCMFARALWGDERKYTTFWDEAYPGTPGSAAGPCQGSSNAHCGATFIPDLLDQASYLPEGHTGCGLQQGAEGIFPGPKSNIPWSIKWSRAFCITLMSEGFWGGHTGPWFHREKFGFSFWDDDPSDNNNNAVLRAKWTGQLMPSLYCNPSEPDCTSENTQ